MKRSLYGNTAFKFKCTFQKTQMVKRKSDCNVNIYLDSQRRTCVIVTRMFIMEVWRFHNPKRDTFHRRRMDWRATSQIQSRADWLLNNWWALLLSAGESSVFIESGICTYITLRLRVETRQTLECAFILLLGDTPARSPSQSAASLNHPVYKADYLSFTLSYSKLRPELPCTLRDNGKK